MSKEKEYVIVYEQKPNHILICMGFIIFVGWLLIKTISKVNDIDSLLSSSEGVNTIIVTSLVGWLGLIILFGWFTITLFIEMLKRSKYDDYGELWKREQIIVGNIIEIKEEIPPKQPRKEEFKIKYKTIYGGQK